MVKKCREYSRHVDFASLSRRHARIGAYFVVFYRFREFVADENSDRRRKGTAGRGQAKLNLRLDSGKKDR